DRCLPVPVSSPKRSTVWVLPIESDGCRKRAPLALRLRTDSIRYAKGSWLFPPKTTLQIRPELSDHIRSNSRTDADPETARRVCRSANAGRHPGTRDKGSA